MKKRLIAFLLVLIMVLGMLPVSALAADGTIVYDGVTLYTNTKPRYFTFLRNNAEGNVTKDVGESGVYQRLPRIRIYVAAAELWLSAFLTSILPTHRKLLNSATRLF